ncbi:MAG: HPF/RaiA family ribosome-associated protein [Pseudorhodoplanes sp.]|jgi:cold shock CspA family protein|nr:HPF/RaiA family ribosome-associated protein [Pseudorhodoplanes sp.]
MQTPVEIDFQGMEPDAVARAAIDDHIAELENRFGRITTCRVVLKNPGRHHRTGGLYEVSIRLALPNGKEVNVSRTPPADERHSDISFAINDAFKHARRQLQDQVRELQGQIKTHDAQPVGTITQLHDDFGFLQTEDGREIYFHRNSVLEDKFPRLTPGTRVIFVEEMGEKGAQASTVKLLGKHRLRP